ncbi:hypothetical protein TNCV_10731 [Trichonephila clavipes]|nr:hypothetical protein TNCV_10731 [Trichonephila clavipes]
MGRCVATQSNIGIAVNIPKSFCKKIMKERMMKSWHNNSPILINTFSRIGSTPFTSFQTSGGIKETIRRRLADAGIGAVLRGTLAEALIEAAEHWLATPPGSPRKHYVVLNPHWETICIEHYRIGGSCDMSGITNPLTRHSLVTTRLHPIGKAGSERGGHSIDGFQINSLVCGSRSQRFG